ncbi:MAG: cold-shock protein, partial [Pseudomonas sp.]|nr:cold-shock protein [Pseudomonas sp.]
MEQRGTLKSWNDQKGFGFIRPQQGGEDVFAHISAVHGERRPLVGDRVLYVSGRDPQGRLRAEHLRLDAPLTLDQPAIRQRPGSQRKPAEQQARPRATARAAGKPARQLVAGNIQQLPLKLVLFGLLCLLPLAGSLLRLGAVLPLAIYAVASLLTFVLYWRDKHSALKDRWRTPETTLHFFELAGGWPGALVAQQVFRHKTRKLSYQLAFWLIVVLHQAFWIDLLF